MSEGGEGTCLNFDGLEEVDVLLVRIQFEEGTGDVDEVGLGGVVVAKVIKVLITAGVYSTDISVIVSNKHAEGETVAEIQKELGVSRSTVQSYLPYQKGVYNATEISLNAERIRRYRERQRKQKSINLSINLSKDI